MGTKCNMTWKGGTNWNFNIIFDKVLLVLLLIVLIQFLTGNEFRVSVVWHIARMNSHCGNGVSENIGTKVRYILLWHFRTLYAEILKMKWNVYKHNFKKFYWKFLVYAEIVINFEVSALSYVNPNVCLFCPSILSIKWKSPYNEFIVRRR